MKTNTKHWASIAAGILSLAGYASAALLGSEKYTYDASGNISQKQIGDQATRYHYNGNQLSGSVGDSGRKDYLYDGSGRLVSGLEEGNPVCKMEHQYFDKVTKVRNGEKISEFFYNAEGHLVGSNTEGSMEVFAWDGLAMASRSDEVYSNEGHLVGGVPTMAGNEIIVSDIHGSTLSVGGKSFNSSAFGGGLESGFYTGKPFVEELGGFVFKFRNYSAEIARWNLADPSGFPDGLNNFVYVNNDPVANVDPLGLWTSLGQPPTNQTRGTLTPQAPTSAPNIFQTTSRTSWARKWTNSNWDYANSNDTSVAKNTVLDGDFSASTTTSLSVSVGIQVSPITLNAEAAVANQVGTTQHYHQDADPDKAWRARGLVGQGDISQIEATYDWDSTNSKWVFTSQQASTPNQGIRVPGVSGLEYFYEQ